MDIYLYFLSQKGPMRILDKQITLEELKETAAGSFGDMVKAVVDTERVLLAIDAELHSDLEALLLGNGSAQHNLWGINLYPDLAGVDLVEFDSLINLRPSNGNTSRGVDDESTRGKIRSVVEQWIKE